MPSVSCWSVLRDAQSIGDVSLGLLGMPAFSAYGARADVFGEQNAFWLGFTRLSFFLQGSEVSCSLSGE